MAPSRRTRSAPGSLRPPIALPDELLIAIIQQAAHLTGLAYWQDAYEPGPLYWRHRRRALVGYSQVAKQWYSIAFRELRSHVVLHAEKQARRFSRDSRGLQGVRTLSARHGAVHVRDPLGLEEIVSRCGTSLRELRGMMVGMLKMSNLFSCKELRHLHLRYSFVLGRESKRSINALQVSYLERLTLEHCSLLGSFDTVFPTATPHLTTLSLSGPNFIEDQDPDEWTFAARSLLLVLAPQLIVFEHGLEMAVLPPPTAFASLRYLLFQSLPSEEDNKRLHFITNLPLPLHSLTYRTDHRLMLESFATLLRDPSSSLYHLKSLEGIPSGSVFYSQDFKQLENLCVKRGIAYNPSSKWESVGTHSLTLGRKVTTMDLWHEESRRGQ